MTKFNRKVFYDHIRDTIFGGRLAPLVFVELEKLLDVWDEYYSDRDYRLQAHCLATTVRETAHTMAPIMERGGKKYFRKYDIKYNPRKAKILGNTQIGDGYTFRGAGHVQNTGRGNAKKATGRLNAVFNLGIDLVAHPEKRLDPFISAHSLYLGCIEGWWTGKKLTAYINNKKVDYVNARRCVNGLDHASEIATMAVAFEVALKTARETGKTKATSKEIKKQVTTGKSMLKSTSNIATAVKTAAGPIGILVAATTSMVEKLGPWPFVALAVIGVGAGLWLFKERRKKQQELGV